MTTSHTLGDFWRWYASNFGSNTLRDNLAEFIVARALGDDREFRIEWDPFDVLTPKGVRVEVKSSAYVQAWHQEKLSRIEFSGFRGLRWDADTGAWSGDRVRQWLGAVQAAMVGPRVVASRYP